MKKLVAIIVGGTGQFGITTGGLLLKKKFKVIITSRSPNKKKIFKSNRNLIFEKLDIYNKKEINQLLEKYNPNMIFYYAGQSSPSKSFYQKKETFNSNVIGCKNFFTKYTQKKN